MSLTFNLTGGGTNYSPGVAMVRAITKSNATVVMTRGSSTKTPIEYQSTDDAGATEYCFFLEQSDVGGASWTLSATSGSNVETKQVSVPTAGAYTVYFTTMLYDAGEKYTSTTGGYTVFRPSSPASSSLGRNPYGYTDGASSMSFYVYNVPYNMGVNAAFGTTAYLDLSRYTTLHMTITKASIPTTGATSASFMRFGVTQSLDDETASETTYADMSVGNDVTLNISDVSAGHIFFGFNVGASASDGVGPIDIEVTKIWLT